MFYLPLGQADFRQIRENHDMYYIDKSYFIKEWWESSYDKVTLILRPRNFCKSINMSMIDYFFSNRYCHSQYLFRDLSIFQENQIISHQGQYPVISLNFGDLKPGDSESIKNQIKMKIWQIYLNFKNDLISSEKLDKTEKNFIYSISNQIDDDFAIHSIQYLCGFLNKIYNEKQAIVLLDEYDSIITKKSDIFDNNDDWNNTKEFFINFIISTFKENKFMMRGLITGILNIPLLFNFSCFNNITIYDMTSEKYSNYFGFTKDEIIEIAHEYDCKLNIDDVEEWYGGYKFGDIEIFNAYSIFNFFNKKCDFSLYWVETSSNDFIKQILKNSSSDFYSDMILLIQRKSIEKELNKNLLFNFNSNEELNWILLLSSGYLTVEEKSVSTNFAKNIFVLKMPNKEISEFFSQFVIELFEGQNCYFKVFSDSFFRDDLNKMENILNSFVNDNFSLFNQFQNHPEIIYYAFMLGFTAYMKSSFNISLYSTNKDDYFSFLIKSNQNENDENKFIFSFKKRDSDSHTLVDIVTDKIKKILVFFEDLKCTVTSNQNKAASSNQKFQNEEHEEEEEEAKEEENNERIESIPAFDFHRSHHNFHINQKVYVIDKNGYDIYEAVIKRIKGKAIYIHYPDFPNDDEIISGRNRKIRILEKTKKNNEIFEKQEEERNKISDINKL